MRRDAVVFSFSGSHIGSQVGSNVVFMPLCPHKVGGWVSVFLVAHTSRVMQVVYFPKLLAAVLH